VERFDVLVVGGGPAGCVLAARLSENPDRSVCLVEAGPDYGPYTDGKWPADILDGRRLALDSHCWERNSPEDRSQLRARILGGCSAHNACVLLRGAPADYDEWGPAWSYEELAPHFDRGERELRTRVFEEAELSPWHRAFLDTAPEAAIVHPVNAVGPVRWQAGFAYIDPARARENLTILADTIVDRIVLENDRAVGAVAGGRELATESIVLTASAYGSPAILLRSGIGPADDLARQGIPVVAELPVGQGLTDHVGTGAAWEPAERLQTETAAFEREYPLFMGQVTLERRSRSCEPGVCDLFLFPAAEAAAGGYEISAAAYAMKPRSRGSVRLTARDAEAPLAIDHGFLRDERDAEVLTEGFEALRELVGEEIPQRYAGRELRPGAEVDAAAYVRVTARGFFHPTGTCALGRVVDERCRVFGFENLHVADASVMPTIPRSNTHLSTIAIAERAAQWI
jgi:choline dehydrogenase